jgi:hypothetical protein
MGSITKEVVMTNPLELVKSHLLAAYAVAPGGDLYTRELKEVIRLTITYVEVVCATEPPRGGKVVTLADYRAAHADASARSGP